MAIQWKQIRIKSITKIGFGLNEPDQTYHKDRDPMEVNPNQAYHEDGDLVS